MQIRRQEQELIQNCDVYIGPKVVNESWDLDWSEWYNPFNKHEHKLQMYENHIRAKMWNKLDKLEGKLLGCWCADKDECHGKILVELLEEKKIKDLSHKLAEAGLRVAPDHLEEIRAARDWAKDPHFLAYATRLDKSDIFYFQPPLFEAIKSVWGVSGPPYWVAYTNEDVVYYIVGVFKGDQPLGPFWDESAKLDAIDEEKCNSNFHPKMPGLWFIFNFASQLQTHIDENPEKFYQAMKAALFYHTLHRALVRKVGRLNQIDMDDHDLSKSRIVHVALAYSFHWDDTPRDDDLKKLASTAI